jgi:hypothetical protein
MNTSWRIIFACQKGTPANAQRVYNELMKAALMYRYGGTGLAAVPINDRDLTEAIFNLTDHDKITTNFEGSQRQITGKDLRELFIASALLKHLEEKTKYVDGTGLFVVLPETVGACDVGIIVSKREDVKDHYGKALRLSPDHDPYPLQIKEYYDHGQTKETIMVPRDVDVQKLEQMVEGYEEYVLVLMRDMMNFNSAALQTFFDAHPRVALISMPRQPALTFTNNEGVQQEVVFPTGKHNYLVTFPGNAFSIVSFDWPPFLVPELAV